MADEVEGEDLGDPIDALRDHSEAVELGFVGRVVRSVRRRSLGSHLATLVWSAMGQVLVEFLEIVYSLFESHDGDRGDTN
ncbi:MAG: hypothetical protein OEO79_12075 [Gemmatimonadota bacterium]|nr:hypothetical protein [Gemmatimonadota bacterium]MDH3422892.1 hypothetical protein [Gemmatimonadota bacterium]